MAEWEGAILAIQNFKKIKKITAAENIVEQIKEMITNGDISPGEKLPSERELASMMGVSRATVREAMRSLNSLGIVEIKSGEGTFLNENTSILSDHFKLQHVLKKYSVLEMVEARNLLEIEIVDFAVSRATKENIEFLEEMYEETLVTLSSPEDFIRADFAFHMAIAEAAHNAFLAEMLNTTRDLLLEINLQVVQKTDQITYADKGHQAILAAIKARDKNRAKEEMKKHIKMIAEAMNEIYV